ncbi:unnamed protein product [Caenorhabditis auriculariae]|uniref:nicotinamidase n=1 Tax=Caenorhabditis auriculariae TaxID=2777116 RepID=A0A8S1HGP7_9PELO|nr:unnamed protein product [Caenorhabditis auriculariae]
MLGLLLAVLFLVKMSSTATPSERVLEQLKLLAGDYIETAQLKQIIDDFSTDFNEDDEQTFEQYIIKPLKNLSIAFVVVDFQNDFVSGSLSVKEGDAKEDPDKALAPLNRLLKESDWEMIVYTQDWHPSNHISFCEHAHDTDRILCPEDRNKTFEPFEKVCFEKPATQQVLYPTHCVQGSWGAEIHPEVHISSDSTIVRKGTDIYVDSYSAFTDNDGISKTVLDDLLKENSINAVVACGLAYDICVKYTIKDAKKLGYLSAIVSDCSAGFSVSGISEANLEFRQSDVAVLNEQQAADLSLRRFVPIEWIRSLASAHAPN